MALALATGQSFLEVVQWESRDVATALRWLDDRAEAERDAQRGQGQ